jgi:hypothetical protein
MRPGAGGMPGVGGLGQTCGKIPIPWMGLSPSPPGGSRIPPGGIRGVLYMCPRQRPFLEGGCFIPPR